MPPWFIATERFDPSCGDRWSGYIAWSGLIQLAEVVSLDGMLCPTLLPDIEDEFWPHIVNENYLLNFFTDADFLLRRLQGQADWQRSNLLCVLREPTEPLLPAIAPFDAEVLGYDLLSDEASISALSNCGGFPLAFDNAELNRYGLITSYDRARAVQDDLVRHYPEEHHADCRLWGITRRL